VMGVAEGVLATVGGAIPGTVYSIPCSRRKAEENKLPITPTSSAAKPRPSLSLRATVWRGLW
jgi:hypothetical protein